MKRRSPEAARQASAAEASSTRATAVSAALKSTPLIVSPGAARDSRSARSLTKSCGGTCRGTNAPAPMIDALTGAGPKQEACLLLTSQKYREPGPSRASHSTHGSAPDVSRPPVDNVRFQALDGILQD